MSLRSIALSKLKSQIPNVVGPVYTSKIYSPEESWTRTAVWWLELPATLLSETSNTKVNLLCQIEVGSTDFHILQVPVEYFKQNLAGFELKAEKISLFLSAELTTLFFDQRGTGKVPFKQYLIS
jgi:hypothetical protein